MLESQNEKNETTQSLELPLEINLKVSKMMGSHKCKITEEFPPVVLIYFDENCNPHNPKPLKMEKVMDAALFLKDKGTYTPCKPSHHYKNCGYHINYKLESLQQSGSCKDRGILFLLDQLKLQQKKLGIILASMGNSALAACKYGALQSIRVTVVLTEGTPLHKREKCAKYGAKVIVYGKSLLEAQKLALSIAHKEDLAYINGRDHPNILSGYGTIGLEILEQTPDVEAILIPIGTGGLAAGISTVIKKQKPKCLIYGIQTEAMPLYQNAIQSEGYTITPPSPTMAEELALTRAGVNSFNILKQKNVLDRLVTVNERCIGRAVVHMMEWERLVVEGAAATPLAAIIGNYVPELKYKKIVCIVSGGNVDPFTYNRTIERGLAADARLVRFTVHLQEENRDVEKFFSLLWTNGYNVSLNSQRRRWLLTHPYAELNLSCITKNLQAVLQLRRLVILNSSHSVFEPEPFNNKRACPCYAKKKMPL